jgi:hypothetical protein
MRQGTHSPREPTPRDLKPRQTAGLLSIRILFPRQGGGSGMTISASNPNSPDNRWFREAMEQQNPIIYFLGTSPGRYQPIIPTFIVGWHPERLRVQLAFGAIVGASAEAALPPQDQRLSVLLQRARRRHSGRRGLAAAAANAMVEGLERKGAAGSRSPWTRGSAIARGANPQGESGRALQQAKPP